MIPDEIYNYDFNEAESNIVDFFDTFFNDVMDSDVIGLIMYFWNCIPPFIRLFMMMTLVLACILALVGILKGSGEF